MASKILIADDHPLFRDALISIVSAAIENCEISEATDFKDTAAALARESFNLVFLDLNMPDSSGLSELALLKKTYPHIPIVVVSAHEEQHVINACLFHNASGYIIKSSTPESIKEAILTIMSGETYIPKGFSFANDEGETSLAQRLESLTPSQLKVFMEMGRGKLNKQIAFELDITEATVKAHITTVFRKLGINNRTQAVVLAQEHQTAHYSLPN